MKRAIVYPLLLLASVVHAQWTSVAGGIVAGQSYEMYFDSTSQLLFYVGNARYMVAENLQVNGTAFYENGAWHQMGSGVVDPGFALVDEARAVTRYDSAIVVAGSFIQMDSVHNTWQIAQWKNDEWLTMGLDSGDWEDRSLIRNLTVIHDSLFVLGAMQWNVNGVEFDGWAVWDGEHWSSGDTTGMFAQGTVNQVCDFQGMRYAGGNFQDQFPGQPNDLARWNGTAWEAVGGGINGDPWVNEMVVYDDKLWVCGEFSANSGNAASGLMAWDGTQWLNPFPQIAFFAQGRDVIVANGKLYFVGPFYAQGLPGEYHFGVYDGQTLCIFGGPDILDAGNITASADTLYAYCNILGANLNNVAQWPLNGPMDTCYTVVQGVQDVQQAENAIRLFPNPAASELTVNISGEIRVPASRLVVFDVTGQIVQQTAVQPMSGSATVDLFALTPGLYNIRLLDKNDRPLATETFVKY